MDLQEWFKEEQKDSDVSKELFSNKNLKTRTEVSDDEIRAIAKINFACDLFELERFPQIIEEMLELRISKKRKSRGEFIKSLRREQNPLGMGSFFNRGNRGFE